MQSGRKVELPLPLLPKLVQKIITAQDPYIDFMEDIGTPVECLRFFTKDWLKVNDALSKIETAEGGALTTPQGGYSLLNCTYRGLEIVKRSDAMKVEIEK